MGDLGLLDSLVSLRADGSLIVGRGVPSSWAFGGRPVTVSGFPAGPGRRVGVTITGRGTTVTLRLTGKPAGPVAFELPAFVDNIAAASSGAIDQAAGSVTVPAGTGSVTVALRHPPVS